MAELNPAGLKRLHTAIATSRKQLKVFRENRLAALKLFVGSHYSKEGSPKSIPINVLENAVSIHVAHIVAHNPKVLGSSPHPQLGPFAGTSELAINHLLKEIDARQTIRKLMYDAMFVLAIAKTGLGPHSQVEIEGYLHDVGQPFWDRVDFDDWVHDTAAHELEECSFMGNRYTLPYEYVMDTSLYRNKKGLRAGRSEDYGGEGKAEYLSAKKRPHLEQFLDYVELWDIWLPLENLVITLADKAQAKKPLRIVEWEGPERGPYEWLYFTDVPNNIMPLPPVAQWQDLTQWINELVRKQGRQAQRQKNILAYEAAAAEDAERIASADDGEIVRVDDVARLKEMEFGGVSPANYAFTIWLIKQFSQISGNIEMLGGLGAQAPTLGQEQLMAGQSAVRVEDRRDCVYDFCDQNVRKLAWYLWNDPLIELPLVKRIPELDMGIPVTFSAEEREGDFQDYNFTIELYSMQRRTPEARRAKLLELFDRVLMPGYEIGLQQGVVLNFEEFARLFAKLGGEENIDSLLQSAGNMPISTQTPGMVGKPPTTRREQVRYNVSGMRAGQSDDEAIQQLMSSSEPKAPSPTQGG